MNDKCWASSSIVSRINDYRPIHIRMISIAGTLGLMIVLIILGKKEKEIRLILYLIVAFIAMLQVLVVLLSMYTASPPNF